MLTRPRCHSSRRCFSAVTARRAMPMSRGGRGLAGLLGHRRRGRLAGNRLVSRWRAARSARCAPRAYNQHPVPTPCAIALDAGSARRAREGPGSAPAAQTPSALGQPAVHLHVVVDRLRTGRMEGYRRGCRWAIGGFGAAREGPKGTARDGISVRTGMAVSSLCLTLVWIGFF